MQGNCFVSIPASDEQLHAHLELPRRLMKTHPCGWKSHCSFISPLGLVSQMTPDALFGHFHSLDRGFCHLSGGREELE